MATLPPGAPPRDPMLESALSSALNAKGEGHHPRTHHLEADGSPTYTNRLILETSPYLLQHAHNPVDWWPWGDAAFEEARRLEKPVFLSVGYATCHWCHVMERESFEDEAIAALLNEGYVPIKVDREERPDIDAIYMSALQALTGQGGWPMNVWLNHQAEPFFAGTYFPPEDRYGRVGFPHLLRRIAELWTSDRPTLGRQAQELTRALRAELSMGPDVGMRVPGPEILHQAAAHFRRTYDSTWGGFGGAPKFPRSEALRFLLRYHLRTGDQVPLEIVRRTLFAMSEGGMHDHVGGGFARYSVDREWLVPHFEKMLYDNALLVIAYLEGYLATGEERFAAIGRDVLEYVEREMTSPEGAFFSATDADSEGEEGRFFVWTAEELDEVLGPDLGRVSRAWFGVSDRGNFEGRSVLHTFRAEEEVACDLGMDVETLRSRIEESRRLLYEAREKRIHPELDDKVIASWNGLMIGAFATAARVLGVPRFAKIAAGAADFVLEKMRDEEGRLHRTWRSGTARHVGMLDDYAFVVSALLDLFEATGAVRWLEAAELLQGKIDEHFTDPRGGWYSTPDDHEDLLTRPREVYEGAIPTGSSVSASNCLRLHSLTGEERYRESAEGALRSAERVLHQAPEIAPTLLSALDRLLDRSVEILLVRPEPGSEAPISAALRNVFAPNAVRLSLSEADRALVEERLPFARDRRPVNGEETAYICVDGTCRLPTTEPDEAVKAVSRRDSHQS